MILKIFLLVLYFMGPNPTFAIEGMNMRDINSVEIFINNIRERAWSYYNVEKVLMSIDEKTNILKMIFYDLSNILTELNIMSADSQREFSSGDLVYFIDTLEELERKNNYSLNLNLSEKLTKIFNISQAINYYVEPLQQLGASNISDQDVFKLCPTKENGRQDVEFEFERQIILKKYKELVQNLTKINDEVWSKFCGFTPSLNQAVFDYFHKIIATYLKEYVMLYYIDIIDARCLNYKVGPLLHMRQNECLIELKENIKLTKLLFNETKFHIHNCDAVDHEIGTGKAYIELKRMKQTIIIAESQLSAKGSCNHNCQLNKIDSINYGICDGYESCQYKHSRYYVCEEDSTSSRRYTMIIAQGAIYGEDDIFCLSQPKLLKSYYDRRQFRSCDYCMCTCIKRNPDSENEVTAINLREQVTDIDNNKVAVGIRFVERQSMIHLQLKEKNLLFNETGTWKSLEKFSFHKSNATFYVKAQNLSQAMKLGKDYAHPKSMALDNLIAPEGFVVTGARFGLTENSVNNGMIQLEIRVTPFDYVNKKLVNLIETHWISPKKKTRGKLELIEPDKPSRSRVNSINSKANQFVEFQISDLVKDAGQTTVPYFDAQDVESPKAALGGIGVVHRGREGYGGFLAFKIFDINLAHHFNEGTAA